MDKEVTGVTHLAPGNSQVILSDEIGNTSRRLTYYFHTV